LQHNTKGIKGEKESWYSFFPVFSVLEKKENTNG